MPEALLFVMTNVPKPGDGFIAISPAMKRVRELMKRAATSDLPVIIVGDENTGKEYVARQIHDRRDRTGELFVAVDCSPESQYQQATLGTDWSGTLFIAEIASMPLLLQLQILRAFSNSNSSAEQRLVATASLGRKRRHDDHKAVTHFRQRIYRHYGSIIIDIPSLRKRRADILPLARRFLAQARSKSKMTMDAAVERALEAYDWPENIAELKSVVTQAAQATKGTVVTVDALGVLPRAAPAHVELAPNMTSLRYHEMLDLSRHRVAREYFASLLRETNGNVTHTAKRARVGRESLYPILKQLGLSPGSFRRK